jgi:4a-hydroxytetrahydrobiopterin dehydratase
MPCRDIPILTPDELNTLMTELPEWTVAADQKSIIREFKTKDFLEAMKYINASASICEELNHHADMHLTNWNNIKIEISTHSAGAITKNDLSLATKLNTIQVEFSQRWLKETGVL